MRLVDKSGNRYGKLVVIRRDRAAFSGGKVFWLCKCDCGNAASINSISLRNGEGGTKSCGCLYVRKRVMIGERIGKLVVISKVENSPNAWLCRCDCGKELELKGFELLNNRKACSISCAHKHPLGQTSFNALYGTYKKIARNRGYEWNLSKDEFRDITSKNCFYCGVPPLQNARHRDLNGAYVYNGIDRVDNSKGYVVENVVPCCGICNVAKRHHSIERFKDWVVSVYNHWASKS